MCLLILSSRFTIWTEVLRMFADLAIFHSTMCPQQQLHGG